MAELDPRHGAAVADRLSDLAQPRNGTVAVGTELGLEAAAAQRVDKGDLGYDEAGAARAARPVIVDELPRDAAIGGRVVGAHRRDDQAIFETVSAERQRLREGGTAGRRHRQTTSMISLSRPS